MGPKTLDAKLCPDCNGLLKPYYQVVWDYGRKSSHPARYCEHCRRTYYDWQFDCPKERRERKQVHVHA